MGNDFREGAVKSLSVSDFEAAFGEALSPYVAERINKYCFQYTEISPAENEQLLIRIVDALLDPNLEESGEHRLQEWEAGWGENFDILSNDPDNEDSILPKYFNKYGAIRWCGRFIRPVSQQFERHSLGVILDWLFEKYMREAPAIYEFGCGTGHNLLRARNVNSRASLWGLDWASASQRILERLGEAGIDADIHGHRFDYFKPDQSFRLEPDAILYTVASLEQVGSRWEPFIDYVLANRPRLCVHVEPIAELLDPTKLIDYLSMKYFLKRNYLKDFLTGLRALEADGKVKIHCAQRTHIGSLFIEGYSVVVWSPT
jgi:hypothetical protein